MNVAAFLWALEHLSPPRGHRGVRAFLCDAYT